VTEKQPIATAPKDGTWIFVSKGPLEILVRWDKGMLGLFDPCWCNVKNGSRLSFDPDQWRRHPEDSQMSAAAG
jgi:hypothetical protein